MLPYCPAQHHRNPLSDTLSQLAGVADAARSPEAVEAFHTATLEAGGRDNGAPGSRPHYREGYYAAFIIDPDGNNVEAVHLG